MGNFRTCNEENGEVILVKTALHVGTSSLCWLKSNAPQRRAGAGSSKFNRIIDAVLCSFFLFSLPDLKDGQRRGRKKKRRCGRCGPFSDLHSRDLLFANHTDSSSPSSSPFTTFTTSLFIHSLRLSLARTRLLLFSPETGKWIGY